MSRYVISETKIKNICISQLIIIALFRPRTLDLYGGLSKIFYLYQIIIVIAGIILVLILAIKRETRFLGRISYIVIVYETYCLYCIYENGLLGISSFVNAEILIFAIIFSAYLLKKMPKEYVLSLSYYTGILVFINNMSYFHPISSSFTDATGNLIYFWSTKNHLSSLFFIAFVSAVLNRGINITFYSKCWELFVLINIVWGTIMFNSSTTIVGMAVLLASYILFKKRSILYKPVLCFVGTLGLNIAIVIFRIQNIFMWFIKSVLNKDLTFTGRTKIWDTALHFIYKSPVIGYGQSSIFSFSFASSEIPAHNQFLDIAIMCGIPGMILFLLILLLAFSKLAQNKDSSVGRILISVLLGYMIMSITESPSPYQPWFIIFALIEELQILDQVYFSGLLSTSLCSKKIKIRKIRM